MTTFIQRLVVLSASVAPPSLAFLAPLPPRSSLHYAGSKSALSGAPMDAPLNAYDAQASNVASSTIGSGVEKRRREFLFQSIASIAASAALSSFPMPANADDSENSAGTDYLYKRSSSDDGDLTSRMFNPDGSLRDPNTVVEAQSRSVDLSFSSLPADGGIVVSISTDGAPATSSDSTSNNNLKATYKLPTKWNDQPTADVPLYFDASEGKNGKACNRISVYSVTAPNLSMKTLEKASNVGVAKSLQMDTLPGKYFDQGVLKADLISGRTTRKPILINKESGEYDEQIYYEFDLAFAPLECPSFTQGNKENLGLGFCPYDNIFLVAATVLKNDEKDKNGTLMVCVVECNKDEWKIANSDLKRVRSSFTVERV